MSTQNKVIETVHDVVKNIIDDRHDISMTSDLIDDLNADSLDLVEIIIDIETQFDIEIPDKQMETMRTVGDIVFYVNSVI